MEIVFTRYVSSTLRWPISTAFNKSVNLCRVQYLLKHYLLTNGERSDVLDMWKTAVKTTKERLISGVKGFTDLTFVTQWKHNKPIYKMEHLVCIVY